MTSRDFCFWLQGLLEASDPPLTTMSETQVTVVKAHLNLVFKHEIDPSMGPTAHQDALNEIHHGPFPPEPPRYRC